ncbi:MAG: hypothetical protein PUD24_00280 [Oscillospiraceae bacterium]|nr:hypothetical protein [Oscillospiraceae bacterium]
MVAVSYLNNGEVELAKNYLSDVLDNLNKTYSYIQTGNSVMNYIINSKLEKAHSKGIGFKAEIENLPFEKMGSVDFSALLSNILDNAVEASINSLMSTLLNNYSIKDISVKEPEIDAIISDIYQGKIIVH